MLGELDDGAGGAIASRSGPRRRAPRRRSASSAPTHIGHGSSVEKIVASASRALPELAGGLAERDDDGVGGRVVRLGTRSWARATIASSTTATAAIGRSPAATRVLRLGEGLAHEQLVVHRVGYRQSRIALVPRRTAIATDPPPRGSDAGA